MTQARLHLLTMSCSCACAHVVALLVQADDKGDSGPSNPEFEGKHSRFPKGHPKAGQFSPKSNSDSDSSGKSKKKGSSDISSKLNKVDPDVAADFEKLLKSSEVKELEDEMEKAFADLPGGSKAHKSAHGGKDEHGHGGGVGESLKAVGLGAVFDLGVSRMLPEIEKLGELEDGNEITKQMGKVAAAVVSPMLILFSNLAPEILLGEALSHALPTALVQMGVVMGVTKIAEDQIEKHGLEPDTGNELTDEMISTAVEVAIMGAASVTTREAWMKLRKSGIKNDKLDKVLAAREKTLARAKEMYDQKQTAQARKLARDTMPDGLAKAIKKVSTIVSKIAPRRSTKPLE